MKTVQYFFNPLHIKEKKLQKANYLTTKRFFIKFARENLYEKFPFLNVR